MNFWIKKNMVALVAGAIILTGAMGTYIIHAYPRADTGRAGIHRQQINPDQAAQRIADKYGIDKTELLSYQAKGIRFRDLSRAAFLARVSNQPLQKVMSLKSDKNTWKDVAQSLGITKEQAIATRQDLMATRLESKLNIPKQNSLELLQQGYRGKDIAVANELAKNTGKSVIDILSMRKINNTWHDVALTLGVDDTTYKQDMKNIRDAFPHRNHRARGKD
jgi:hypothetical protein